MTPPDPARPAETTGLLVAVQIAGAGLLIGGLHGLAVWSWPFARHEASRRR